MRQQFAALADWLDRNDYGYPLGLLCALLGGAAWIGCAWVPGLVHLGFVLFVLAFVLCWGFG